MVQIQPDLESTESIIAHMRATVKACRQELENHTPRTDPYLVARDGKYLSAPVTIEDALRPHEWQMSPLDATCFTENEAQTFSSDAKGRVILWKEALEETIRTYEILLGYMVKTKLN